MMHMAWNSWSGGQRQLYWVSFILWPLCGFRVSNSHHRTCLANMFIFWVTSVAQPRVATHPPSLLTARLILLLLCIWNKVPCYFARSANFYFNSLIMIPRASKCPGGHWLPATESEFCAARLLTVPLGLGVRVLNLFFHPLSGEDKICLPTLCGPPTSEHWGAHYLGCLASSSFC